jgi:hypothetical protein
LKVGLKAWDGVGGGLPDAEDAKEQPKKKRKNSKIKRKI